MVSERVRQSNAPHDELEAEAAAQTSRESQRPALRKLVLDFSGLEFIDSAGIGMLAVCCGLMEREGGKVAIVGTSGRVKELLEITHLDRVAAMYPDVTSAQNTLSET